MPGRCPYLEYRPLSSAEESEPRAYCAAKEAFVQPMRADICNGRYGLDHVTDCEIYRAHEGLGESPQSDGNPEESDDGV